MVVLASPAEIAVPPPAPAGSESYQAELQSIRAAQAALTDEQRKNIDYWAAGGVLRWNEIMRELVARADLPPAPRPDGSYPAPDPDNPFADPQYPFSNPPYAARAYSYVSVAQSDALKAAWYYKQLYGRPSPSTVDGGIQALMPASGVPAYPSEDAVEVGRQRGAAEAALPDVGRGDHAQGRGAARGGPALRTRDGQRHRRRHGARRGRGGGVRCRVRRRTACGPPARRR